MKERYYSACVLINEPLTSLGVLQATTAIKRSPRHNLKITDCLACNSAAFILALPRIKSLARRYTDYSNTPLAVLTSWPWVPISGTKHPGSSLLARNKVGEI